MAPSNAVERVLRLYDVGLRLVVAAHRAPREAVEPDDADRSGEAQTSP
jgi:hypothetical protein